MDLRMLHELTEEHGPFATVYLDASHDTEDAAHTDALRWQSARAELADAGADQATLEALDAAVEGAEPPVGRSGRVLVAARGRVLLDRVLPEPPARSGARFGPLPDLLPLVLDQPEPVPAVVVRVDKQGGEVLVTDADGGTEEVDRVSGEDWPLHKTRGGGLGTLRMQHKVEETWHRNVAGLAAQVDTVVAQTAARVLVLAGEAQSRSQLRKELGERAAQIAVELEGTGGSAGPGTDELAAAVDDAVRDVVTAERRDVIERYDKAAGRSDGLAVQGVDAVLAALRAEAVDTLLLDGGTTRDEQVWITDAPTQLARTEDELRAIGAEPREQVPLDAALVRAAVGCDATIVPIGGGRTGLVGHPIENGVGALLRYPLPPGA